MQNYNIFYFCCKGVTILDEYTLIKGFFVEFVEINKKEDVMRNSMSSTY